jgi:hypothetical protein
MRGLLQNWGVVGVGMALGTQKWQRALQGEPA